MGDRQRISSVAIRGSGKPWSHLLPVLRFEQSLGNKVTEPFDHQDQSGWFACSTRDPLHIAELRAAFDFPPSIALSDGSSTTIHDGENYVWIWAPGDLSKRGPAPFPNGPVRRWLNRRFGLPEDF